MRKVFAAIVLPIVLLLVTSCHVNSGKTPHADYAAWSQSNTDRSWTNAAERAVRETSLTRLIPHDIGRFCPTYSSGSAADRVEFWVGLLSAMAMFESDFDPATAFTERMQDRQGADVVSRGLLQISIESANQRRYAYNIGSADSLPDPATNIACGARILSSWVSKDGVVAYGEERNLGGARYWSVLRQTQSALPKIGALTRRLRACNGA